jgi:Yip1 domain
MDDSTDVVRGEGGKTTAGGAVEVAWSEVPPPPDPGPIGRLVGVFIRPRATFESMRERPRFLIAFIILLVVQTTIAFVLFHSGIVAEQTVAKMEAQGKDPRAIEQVQSFFEGTGGLIITVLTAPVATAIGLVSGAAILFFMANLMMGARLRFAHYLSAVAFAGIVQLVDQLVRVGLILANRSFDVRLGLGMLFGDSTGFGVRALDTLTDPLFLWGNAIGALAVGTYSKRGFGFGVLATLPGVILAVILSANR